MTDDEILIEVGFEDAPPHAKAKMVENIKEVVEMRVMHLADALMTPTLVAEFDRLVAGGDDAAVWRFFSERVFQADLDEVRDAAMLDYLDEFNRRASGLNLE